MVYLDLERIGINTKVAGLLPRKLAKYHHALPLAAEGEQVTVAVANPEDRVTRDAIIEVLGPAVYFVRVDCQLIDKLLAEYWASVDHSSLELLLWSSKTQTASTYSEFFEYLEATLGAHRHPLERPVIEINSPPAVTSLYEQFDAERLIIGKPKEMVQCASSDKDASPLAFYCLLVVSQPNWPIKNILLLLNEDALGESALNWTINIAQPTGANVTILPFTSSIPENFYYESVMRRGKDSVLSTQTRFGRKLRLVAQTLVENEISGMLRFRQEPPVWQIRFELLENEYELVIADCGSHNWFWQSILAEAVTPLFSWTKVPMLIIKSPAD